MENKQKIFKKILTTASAFAMLAGGVQVASAAGDNEVKTTSDVVLTDGDNMNLSANWANESMLVIDANRRNVTIGLAAVQIKAINLNNFGDLTITVPNTGDGTKIGSIGGLAAGGAKTKLLVVGNTTVVLTGTDATSANSTIAANDYSGLGDIDISDNLDSTLKIDLAAPVLLQ